jgi:Cu/Ag efflux pump CusA
MKLIILAATVWCLVMGPAAVNAHQDQDTQVYKPGNGVTPPVLVREVKPRYTDEAKREGRLRTLAEVQEAIVHGAVKRVRPKMMTVMAAMMGLMPIMWSMGAGSDVMKRVAAPMVGGLATSFLLELLVYPAVYLLWKQRDLRRPSLT